MQTSWQARSRLRLLRSRPLRTPGHRLKGTDAISATILLFYRRRFHSIGASPSWKILRRRFPHALKARILRFCSTRYTSANVRRGYTAAGGAAVDAESWLHHRLATPHSRCTPRGSSSRFPTDLHVARPSHAAVCSCPSKCQVSLSRQPSISVCDATSHCISVAHSQIAFRYIFSVP
jgi:hypothetical protein